MATRYPLIDTLLWPFFHVWPSLKNATGLERAPLSHTFVDAPADELKRVVFFGDLCCMYGEAPVEASEAVGEVFRGADLIVGNLEAPVVSVERHPRPIVGVRFRMSLSWLSELLSACAIDTGRLRVSLANNHLGDWKRAGWEQTLAHLEQAGIGVLGRWRGQAAPFDVVQLGELKLGLAAWTRWMNRRPFDPGDRPLEDTDVPGFDWPALKASHELDALIGFPHWEYEFKHFPRAGTRALARELMTERGFDLLVGNHPHVLQPIEWIDGRVCHYSLGNFVAIQFTWPTKLTSLFEVSFRARGPQRGQICGYRQVPLSLIQDASGQRRLVTLPEAPQELQAKCQARLERLFVC